MQFTARPEETALLDLPWSTPLEDWQDDRLVEVPRGISRHVVRFVSLAGTVYAIKETRERIAEREFGLLTALKDRGMPVVEVVGVLSGRATPEGEPVEAALVTRHLQFSLPYRALFSGWLEPDLAGRLLDALAQLLVQLHLTGFYWGDVSLSNTLFRRDAGALAAYLVDAETGELHTALSPGQRNHDLTIALENVAAELMDLDAAGLLAAEIDPVGTAEQIVHRYETLWSELTREEVFGPGERYLISARLARINELGFDAARVNLVSASPDGKSLRLVTQVVEPGHHHRRLLRLTGLDVQENQARRLLNDLDTFRAATAPDATEVDEPAVAHRWLRTVFDPVVTAIPAQLRAKLEPAEVFHEVLEHRWFLSETAGRDVGLMHAVRSYVDTVLAFRPDERSLLPGRPEAGDPDGEEPGLPVEAGRAGPGG